MLEKKYKYFSDPSVITRLSNFRLHKMMETSGTGTMTVSPPERPAWTLRSSELSSPDKYYYFGGYIPSPARDKGKSRPAIDGAQTFTATDWNALLKRRVEHVEREKKLTGARIPPSTSYSVSYLNWPQEAEARKVAKDGLPIKERTIPRRPPDHVGVEIRQPLGRDPFTRSTSAPTMSLDSNSIGGMSEGIRHIFPNGHVTYDQLLKQPWKYNDEMRVTGTTHTSYPMELNC